jgi:cytochrome c peroxidase
MFRRITTLLILLITNDLFAQETSLFQDFRRRYERRTSFSFPDDNKSTDAKRDLGQVLFFDPRLSGNNAMSCATCHNPALAWSDGQPRAIGSAGKALARRTPSLLNVAFAYKLMWDSEFTSLEDQALAPIRKTTEMNQDLGKLPAEIKSIAGYAPLFEAAFPGEGISLKTIAKALAVFQRTIVSGVSPWERFLKGEDNAMSIDAKLGMQLFNEKANCSSCHMGWTLSDDASYDIGLKTKDKGRGALTREKWEEFKFKTPRLLDVAQHPPYMHDGSLPDLESVIEFYNRGGDVNRPGQSRDVRPLHLTARESYQLLAYLKALSAPLPVIKPIKLPD